MKAVTLIKEASNKDSTLITDLIRKSYQDVADRFGLTFENCPKHPSNCSVEWIDNDFTRGVIFFILEHNSIPVGCVALEKAGPDLCYLERLAVLPESRRKGFGKLLVEHVITRAKALGTKKISIGIIAQQTELKLWYQKLKFVEGESKRFKHLPFLVTFMMYEQK